MKILNCGTGHGMPEEVSASVARENAKREETKRKKQAEDFAKNSLPTKESVTTTVHESKYFPFQIVEIITTDNENGHSKQQFRIGMCGQFVSEKEFAFKEKAEKYIASRPWELITNLVCLTFKNAFEYEKSQSNN